MRTAGGGGPREGRSRRRHRTNPLATRCRLPSDADKYGCANFVKTTKTRHNVHNRSSLRSVFSSPDTHQEPALIAALALPIPDARALRRVTPSEQHRATCRHDSQHRHQHHRRGVRQIPDCRRWYHRCSAIIGLAPDHQQKLVGGHCAVFPRSLRISHARPCTLDSAPDHWHTWLNPKSQVNTSRPLHVCRRFA